MAPPASGATPPVAKEVALSKPAPAAPTSVPLAAKPAGSAKAAPPHTKPPGVPVAFAPTRPGEPPFQLKLDPHDRFVFKGDRMFEGKIKRRASRSQKAFIAFSFSLKRTMEIQLQQHYSPLYLQLVLQLQEVSLHRLKLPQTQPTVSAFAATLAQAAKVSPGAPAAAVATPVAAASTPIPAK
uniref:Oxidoreductase-like domain-containing protein n=1 Tax=Parascaris univalens TaxID=6257 RepID=A0A915A2K1_PARUN